MSERLAALRRADEPAGAARNRLALGTGDRRSADRTRRRQLDDAGVGRPPLGQHPDHLRNHVTRAPHDHGIADPHVLARELIHVVQGHVAHGDAADEHGLEPRDGRQRPGTPNLELDRADDGRRLLGLELVRDGPAWGASNVTELALPVDAIHLVYDSVDIVGERVTALGHPGVIGEAALGALHDRGFRGRAQTELAQRRDDRALARWNLPALDGAEYRSNRDRARVSR